MELKAKSGRNESDTIYTIDNPWWNWKVTHTVTLPTTIKTDNPWWNWKIITTMSSGFINTTDNPWWNWKWRSREMKLINLQPAIILDGIESSWKSLLGDFSSSQKIILDGIESTKSLIVRTPWEFLDNPWWNWKW